MHYKTIENLFLIVSLSFALSACSAGSSSPKKRGGKANLGAQVSTAVSSELVDPTSDLPKNHLFISDQSYPQILDFDVDPFEVSRVISIPEDYQGANLLVGPGGKYLVVFSGASFIVVNRESEVLGEIYYHEDGATEGVAFDPLTNRMALILDTGAIGLIQLAEDGSIERDWLGGPIIDSKSNISAGTFLKEGPLVFAVENNSLALVDFAKSIKKSKWTYETVDLETSLMLKEKDETKDVETESIGASINGINWLAQARSGENILLGLTADGGVFSFDVDAKAFLGFEASEGNKNISYGLSPDAHVLRMANSSDGRSSNEHDVVYVDEDNNLVSNILSSRYLTLPIWGSVESYFDLDEGILRALRFPNDQKDKNGIRKCQKLTGCSVDFISVRITDSLVLGRQSLERSVEIGMGEKHLVSLRKSKFGYAERVNIGGRNKTEIVKGFNLENFLSE